jgi:hypothetical protein
MATTLAEIRAKLQNQENRNTGGATQGGDKAIYSHWNIPEGTTSRVRFLPDGDSKNTFFWIERAMIKLPFAGVKGQAESKTVYVQVPCMEMWNETCPILSEVRPWFKDKTLEEMGRKYWKKRSYLFQGFVHEDPMNETALPENPIRRFIISPQIFNIVKGALMDPDMEELPTDYEAGLDFQIVKTSKGGYADYSTSKWARKETALTAEERAAIDTYGLYKLSDFLPKKPGDVELRVIKEMFEASVAGEPYDPEAWGQYYKPSGVNIGNSGGSNESAPAPRAAAPAPAPVASAPAHHDDDMGDDDGDTPAPTAPVQAKPSSQRAEDILAMIRNRQK